MTHTRVKIKRRLKNIVSPIGTDTILVISKEKNDIRELVWLNLLSTIYPVGCIYMSTVSTNPGDIFGGTWVSFGTGRTPVGYDSGQTEFDAVEKTGGSKTHQLTSAEMPSHTHTQDAHNHTMPVTTGVGLGILGGGAVTGAGITGSTIATNQNTGGDQAHNNLQPYIVVYMFKRTA